MTQFVYYTHKNSVFETGDKALIFMGPYTFPADVTETEKGLIFTDVTGKAVSLEKEVIVRNVELSICTRENISIGDVVYTDDLKLGPRVIKKIENGFAYFSDGYPGHVALSAVFKKIAAISPKATFVKCHQSMDGLTYKLLAVSIKTGNSRNLNEHTPALNPKTEEAVALIECPYCGAYR